MITQTAALKAMCSASDTNKWRVRTECGVKISMAVLAEDEEQEAFWRARFEESYRSENEEMPVLSAAKLRSSVDMYKSLARSLTSLPVVAEMLPGWQDRFENNLREMSEVLLEHADGLDREDAELTRGGVKKKKWQAKLGLKEAPLLENFMALLGQLAEKMETETEKMERGRGELEDSLEHMEATLARFAAELYRRTHGNALRRRR